MPASLSTAVALAGLFASVPLPVRLPADVDDAYSLRVNPAGLGMLRGSELRLLWGRDQPQTDGVNGLGIFGAANLFRGFTIGAGYEVDLTRGDAPDPTRTSLGFGFGGPSGGIGFGWERVSQASSRSLFTAGLTLRPATWLSMGFVVRDLSERVAPREYDLGLALRPGTDRALVSGRWRLLQGRDVFGADQDVAARLEVEVLAGLFAGAGFDYVHEAGAGHFGVTAGFRLALEHFSIGSSVEDTTRSTGVAVDLAIRSRPTPFVFAPERVAVVDLAGDLVPDPTFNPFAGGFRVSAYGEVPLLLDELQRADHLGGVLVRIAPLQIGWGKAVEVRDGLRALRQGGRRVDCVLSGSGDLEYFIASACSSIMLYPTASLELNGVSANVLFFAEALDKLGVDVTVARRGAYKSAPEALTRSGMSKEQAEALGAYVDRVYGTLIEGITAGRGLQRSEVESILAQGTVTATEAVGLKLADRTIYHDELEVELGRLYGHPVTFASAESVVAPARVRWSGRPRIAILHVDATIAGGESKSSPFGGTTSGAQTIVEALEAVRQDSSVVGVLLRVDSPGGDALASDLIAHAVKLCDDAKPVIVSFGDTAASGGYYVAARGRAIYAEPTTLTGSIGVFSVRVAADRLLAKLGITSGSVDRGPLSASGNVLHPMTPAEQKALERSVDAIYRDFLQVVAEGRKKDVAAVRAIAEGRIWSGADAREKGLVDELGGLVDALQRVKREAGLEAGDAVELVTLPSNRAQLPVAVRMAGAAAESFVPPRAPGLSDLLPHELASAIAPLVALSQAGVVDRPLALLPFVADID